MYDRDGFNGGKFVLNCAFGWQDRKEVAEIKHMQNADKMKKKELKMKKNLLEGSDDSDDAVTINIVRASKKGVETSEEIRK